MSGPLKGGRNTVIRPRAWLIIHPGTEAQARSPVHSVPQRTEGKMLGPLASKVTSGYPQEHTLRDQTLLSGHQKIPTAACRGQPSKQSLLVCSFCKMGPMPALG